MALCETTLPENCAKYLVAIVENISDDALQFYAQTEPSFRKGGFRMDKIELLRTRLRQVVCGKAVISERLRTLLSHYTTYSKFLPHLTPEALSELSQALVVCFGREKLLVDMLLDKREAVRSIAEGWLQKEDAFLELSEEDARQTLHESFAPLLNAVGYTPGDTSAVCYSKSWGEQKERLESRLESAQEENRRLKKVEGRLLSSNRELVKIQEERKRLKERLAESGKELTQTQQLLERAQAELKREVLQREERVSAALEAALAVEYFGWVKDARVLEAESQSKTGGLNLMEKAEQALRQQAASDRHSGNRQQLLDHLGEMEAVRKRVVDALCNSLSPLSELRSVAGELDEEIARIRNILYPESDATTLEAQVLERFSRADENELPWLRTVPQTLRWLSLLDEAGERRVVEVFNQRLSLAELKGEVAREDDIPTAKLPKNVAALGRVLKGQADALVLVDGHNMLFGLPSRYAPRRGEPLSEAEKRDLLADDFVRLARPNPAMRVFIVFDGPERSDTNKSHNVLVTYSGGTGEHRADGVILDKLRFFQSVASAPLRYMVSDDQDLRKAALKLGAEVVGIKEMALFL